MTDLFDIYQQIPKKFFNERLWQELGDAVGYGETKALGSVIRFWFVATNLGATRLSEQDIVRLMDFNNPFVARRWLDAMLDAKYTKLDSRGNYLVKLGGF